jgi:predicted ferric reductase
MLMAARWYPAAGLLKIYRFIKKIRESQCGCFLTARIIYSLLLFHMVIILKAASFQEAAFNISINYL